MKFIILTLVQLLFSNFGLALSAQPLIEHPQSEYPLCHAQLKDEVATVVAEARWQEQVFIQTLSGDQQQIKISTSVGNQNVMSLWVRNDLEQPKPHGFFTFIHFAPKQEQKFWFYLDSGYFVEITCLLN